MYYFIVNPGSRSGNGKRVWKTVEELLEQENVEYRVYFTSHRYHATKLAREITSCSRESRIILVAVGGDGTVNECLNGISDFSRVTFAYIPTGSSNDFARSLGLPSDTEAALRCVLHPSRFGRIDLGAAEGAAQTRCFAVSCGCGFDAAICHDAFSSRAKKVLNRLRLGKLTYIATGVKRLVQCSPAPMTIILDENRTLRFRRTWFAVAMNCRFEGGGVRFCPSARTDDGLIDICVVEGPSRLLIVPLFFLSLAGLHRLLPGVHLCRARTAEFRCPRQLPVHMDGEPYYLKGSLRIRCLPAALPMILS